jgi:DNA polymerase
MSTPSANVYIDFETRSHVNLKKVGSRRYALHPSTQVICCAWAEDEGPVQLWKPGDPMFPVVGRTLVSHNTTFERAILREVLGIKHDSWIDTAVMASQRQLPRKLEEVHEYLFGIGKGPNQAAMLTLSKPRKNGEWWTYKQKPEQYELLYQRCREDVIMSRNIYKHFTTANLPPVPVWEDVNAELTEWINAHGVTIDTDLVLALIQAIETETQELTAECLRLTGGIEPSKIEALKKWLGMVSLTKNDVAERLQRVDLMADQRRVLEIRQILGLSSTKKLKAIARDTDDDGRLRSLFLYAGAERTLRWAGRGAQPQNLPRETLPEAEAAIWAAKQGALPLFYKSPAKAAKGLLRALFVAQAGCRLVAVDYSSIEARIVCWLAGQDDVVQAYYQGQDVYRLTAGRIFNRAPVHVNPKERQLGKVVVLGCGYGMGSTKLSESLPEDSKHLAQKLVDGYRAVNHKVVDLWTGLEQAAWKAIVQGEGEYRRIQFKKYDGLIGMRLPSGRWVCYWGMDKSVGRLSYFSRELGSTGWIEKRTTWGGSLTENLVQACARDLLAEAVMRVEHYYPIVMHLHDEIVCEVPTIFAEHALEVISGRMLPDTHGWASSLPVAVEGKITERFTK